VTGEQFTVLGLARPRVGWFTEVGRWATSGSLPVEFVRCVSIEELRARLRCGRAWSALLVDHSINGLDRDLIDAARAVGCATVVVGDGSRRHDWMGLGAAAVVDVPVSRDALLATLRTCAAPVERLAGSGADLALVPRVGWEGRMVVVAGSGGTGTSTVAAALAQGLAADPARSGRVVLVDAALDAAQALLHDVGDVVPGLQELVEAHRSGATDTTRTRAMTWLCPDRGYDLLSGLRRHRDWTVLRPRAVEAAFASLRAAYPLVVVDTDADVEGEALTGSVDVEDRNVLARHATATADVVLVTATPTVTGLHRLVRDLSALLDHGVAADRLQAVVVRAPRTARGRAEITMAVTELMGPTGTALTSSPIHLPFRKDLDGLQRDGAPMPRSLAEPLAAVVTVLLDRLDPIERASAAGPSEPVPVRTRSLRGGAA
jgi:MinD-like ATPase involved in chromosome partitioning or flagellar assembly